MCNNQASGAAPDAGVHEARIWAYGVSHPGADGDPTSVSPQDLPPLPTEVDSGIQREAVTFLRRNTRFEPRKQWPLHGMPVLNVRGRIRVEHRAETGRALCIWRDAHWGKLVFRGKYQESRFADALVNACVQLVEEWAPQPQDGLLTSRH